MPKARDPSLSKAARKDKGYIQFIKHTRPSYLIRVFKAFLEARRAHDCRAVSEDNVRETTKAVLRDEGIDVDGDSWLKYFDKSFAELLDDGIIYEVNGDNNYLLTDYGQDLVDDAHRVHDVPYQGFTVDQEDLVVREAVYHFPGTTKRRKSQGGTSTSTSAKGRSTPADEHEDSEWIQEDGLRRKKPKRTKQTAPRRSIAPAAHPHDQYPPYRGPSRERQTFSSASRMDPGPPERDRSGESNTYFQTSFFCATALDSPLSTPTPTAPSPSLPQTQNISSQSIQTSAARVSQQPTPAPSTPDISPEDISQSTQRSNSSSDNAEMERLRQENLQLADQLIAAQATITSNMQLSREVELRDQLSVALSRLAQNEKHSASTAGEILALRVKITTLERALDYQSTEGPIGQLLEERNASITELYVVNQRQAETIRSLQRKLEDVDRLSKDNGAAATSAEHLVMELEASLKKLTDDSEQTALNQRAVNKNQKRKIHELSKENQELLSVIQELKSSRSRAIEEALSELTSMGEMLKKNEATNASLHTNPSPVVIPPPSPAISSSYVIRPQPTAPSSSPIPPSPTIPSNAPSAPTMRPFPSIPGGKPDDPARLKSDLMAAKLTISRSEEERSNLKNQVKTLERRLGEQSSQLDAAQRGIQILQEAARFWEHKAKAVGGDLNSKLEMLQVLTTEMKWLQADRLHYLAQCDTAQNQLAAVTEEHKKCKADLENAIKEQSAATSSLINMTDCFDKAHVEVRSLKAAAESRERRITELSNSLVAEKQRSESIEAELVASQAQASQANALEKNLAAAKDREEMMRKGLSTARIQHETDVRKHQELANVVEEKKEQLEELGGKLQTFEQQNIDLQKQLEMEKSLKADAERSLESKDLAILELATKVAATEAALQDLDETYQALRKSKTEDEQTIAELKTDFGKVQAVLQQDFKELASKPLKNLSQVNSAKSSPMPTRQSSRISSLKQAPSDS